MLATIAPARSAQSLQACPVCLDDLSVRAEGASTTYWCGSCRAVTITVPALLEGQSAA